MTRQSDFSASEEYPLEIDFLGTELRTHTKDYTELRKFLQIKGFREDQHCLKYLGAIQIVVDSQGKLDKALLENPGKPLRLKVAPINRYSSQQSHNSSVEIEKNRGGLHFQRRPDQGQSSHLNTEANMEIIEEMLNRPYLTGDPLSPKGPQQPSQKDMEARAKVANSVVMTDEIMKTIDDGRFPCLTCYGKPELSPTCAECKGSGSTRMDYEAFMMKTFIQKHLELLENSLKNRLEMARVGSTETKLSKQESTDALPRLQEHHSSESNSQNDALNLTVKKGGNHR